MRWDFLHPLADERHLGYIPGWLSEYDPDPAWKQIDKNYAHGGGWHPTSVKFKVGPDHSLRYPGDPPQKPLAVAKLRDETIWFYPHAWVMIEQKDGSYEVCRVD